MIINFHKDGKGQTYIEWELPTIAGGAAYKRAWIQHRTEKDWAGTGRYLNIARVDGPHQGPGGPATDFPIFSRDLTDEEILMSFVSSACAITGCHIKTVA